MLYGAAAQSQQACLCKPEANLQGQERRRCWQVAMHHALLC